MPQISKNDINILRDDFLTSSSKSHVYLITLCFISRTVLTTRWYHPDVSIYLQTDRLIYSL